MKSLINFVLKNKLAVWLLTIIVVFSGIYAGTRMKTEMIPDVSIPYLIVNTVYPGATPEKVMNEVSMPIEKVVENLDYVKNVYSSSKSSVSTIEIEYDYGINMDEAKRELQSAIEDLSLPEESRKPMIMAISMDMMPVVAVSISSKEEDIVSLTSTVEKILLPKIQKLDGVANATISGQHIEEAILKYNEKRMEKVGLTKETVKQMIEASNLSVSLGLREFEDSEEAIAVDGRFTSIEDLREMNIPITPTKDYPKPFLKLKDIAKVELVGKVQSISRTNGKESIGIQITKGQEANTVDVVNKVRDLIKEEEGKIKGLNVEITMDQAEPIEDSVATMVEKAVFGGLIAVIIILLFLRDIKSTIISIISIPVSILMALLLLNYLDITLNIMTLGAITVAIGRVIDDSIVVVENIFRRIHLRDEPLFGRALVREATIEMFKPILSSTLVTVAVFAPLLFVGGMVGELFMPFALTMTFALLSSLLVAITIVPAMSHTLFKKKLYGEKTEIKHKEAGKLARGYKKILGWSLNHKIITSLLAIILLVGSVGLVPMIGFSFMGSEEEKMMYLTYTPAAGELREDTVKNIAEVEEKLLKRNDVEVVQLSITDNSDPMAVMSGSSGGLVYVSFKEDIENFTKVKETVEEELQKLEHSGEWRNMAMSSSPTSSELSYTITSENLKHLNETVLKVEDILNKNKGLTDVSSSKEDSFTEHKFVVDQNELLNYGLTTGQIIMLLNPIQPDEVLTTIEKDGTEIEVIVKQNNQKEIKSIEDILDTKVQTPFGTSAKLGDILEVEKGTTMNTLSRFKGEYYATVSATIKEKDISKVSQEVQKEIDKLELPKGVQVNVSGVTADMIETFTQLLVAMLAAILIVYFILVVTFSEGLAPFAILFSLPFTVIGAFLGLFITGYTISVQVMMGLLMLIGIVVTNAIVLVDRIIRKEREGMEMREAILEAGVTRLRPILMTAIATIGAMLPMALGIGGGGGLMSKDLAITVIGGLLSSTLLTLVIVPIVYEVLSKILRKNRKEIRED